MYCFVNNTYYFKLLNSLSHLTMFNLILTNSHRSKQLSSMESDLNRERYNRLKRDDGKTKLASDDDIQIEIDSSIIHGLINI